MDPDILEAVCSMTSLSSDLQFLLLTVNAECDDNMMITNIYPYGYDAIKMAVNQPPPPETEDGQCQVCVSERISLV